MPAYREGFPLSQDDRGQFLDELVGGEAWARVARPALRRRMQDLAERTARGTKLSEGDLRKLQVEFRLLEQMYEDPAGFFSPPAGDGPKSTSGR